MSTPEGADSEPPFSELISGWLADGDRLSESAAAVPAEQEPQTIVTRAKDRVTDAKERIRHNPAAASVAACALLAFGASVLHHYARARMAGGDDGDRNPPSSPALVVATAEASPPASARPLAPAALVQARPVALSRATSAAAPVAERTPPPRTERPVVRAKHHHASGGRHRQHSKSALRVHVVAANSHAAQRHTPRSRSSRLERATR